MSETDFKLAETALVNAEKHYTNDTKTDGNVI